MKHNIKFYNAINNIPQNTPPIWFMRQAGRYHSHYQALRKRHSFVELCKTPELAAEVALGPINDFDYDAAILFSDILFPLESLGLKLDYKPGPIFENYLTKDLLSRYNSKGIISDNMSFQYEALRLTRSYLPADKSLVGFVGGPWTLFSYGSNIKNDIKVTKFKDELFTEKVLYDILCPNLSSIIEKQLDNGAEIVYLFDTNAKQLEKDYFITKYMQELKNQIFSIYPNKVAYFCKDNPILGNYSSNEEYNLAGMVYGKNDGLTSLLPKINTGFIQGNFDPKHLLKSQSEFESYMQSFVDQMSSLSNEERSGWICSLNHGVLPKSKEENVTHFIKTIRENFK